MRVRVNKPSPAQPNNLTNAPEMQAGLDKKRLSFPGRIYRQVAFFLFFSMVVVARYASSPW